MFNRLGQFEMLTRASAPVLMQPLSSFFFFFWQKLRVVAVRYWDPCISCSELPQWKDAPCCKKFLLNLVLQLTVKLWPHFFNGIREKDG